MKLVFIAGPYRAESAWAIHRHVRAAEANAMAVWIAGGVAVCPHKNTEHFDGNLPDEVWLDGAIEILKRCDAIFMMPGWRASKGATRERDVATVSGIPIFYELGKLESWLIESMMNYHPCPACGKWNSDNDTVEALTDRRKCPFCDERYTVSQVLEAMKELRVEDFPLLTLDEFPLHPRDQAPRYACEYDPAQRPKWSKLVFDHRCRDCVNILAERAKNYPNEKREWLYKAGDPPAVVSLGWLVKRSEYWMKKAREATG